MIWHLFFEIWAKVKKLSEIKPPWGKSLMQFSFISAAKELLLTGNLRLVINNINFLSFYHSKVPNPTFLFLNNHTTKKRSWFQVREIRYYFVAFCERLCPHLINIVQKTQRSQIIIVIACCRQLKSSSAVQQNDLFIYQRHFNKEISSKKK